MEDKEREDTRGAAPPEQVVIDEAKEPKLKMVTRLLKVLMIAILAALFFASILFNVVIIMTASDSQESVVSFHWILISGSLVITAISLGISFWLYYVRSIYIKDGPALVPEKWGSFLAGLSETTDRVRSDTAERLSIVLEHTEAQTQKSELLLESFLTLQRAISIRDEEISRLKKGHDAKIFKRFVTRFIRLSVILNEFRHEAIDSDQSKNYKYLCQLLENALEECGLEQVSPELNTDYREMGPEVADDPNIVETSDQSLEFMIASIDSPAFVIEGETEREVIIPAKVTIYRIQETTKDAE